MADPKSLERQHHFASADARTTGNSNAADLLRRVIDASSDVIIVFDMHSRILLFNAVCRLIVAGLFGVEARVGLSIVELLSHLPTQLERAKSIIDRGLTGEEYSLVEEFGDERAQRNFFEITCTLLRDAEGIQTGVMVSARDITARRQAEDALSQSQDLLAQGQQIAKLGSWEVDRRTGEARWSDQAYRNFGVEPGSFPPTFENIVSMFHPDDRHLMIESQQKVQAGAREFDFEHRLIRPDGAQRWIVVRGEAVGGTPGDPDRLVGTALDITERKEAQAGMRSTSEALRESERRLQMALAAADMGIWAWDRASGQVSWSESVPALFGSPPENFKLQYERIFPADRQMVIHAVERAIRDGTPLEVENRVLLPDGQIRWLSGKGDVKRDANGEVAGISGIVMDITERRQTEEALRLHQAQLAHVGRLNMMGEMVAGVAHEINQPLHAISNFANACLKLMETPGEGREEKVLQWMQKISQQALRAGVIIKRLRNFVRKKEPERALLDVNELVREAVDLTLGEARWQSVEIHFELAPSLETLFADKVQIQQVLVNLLKNAFDSIASNAAQDRRVTVRTAAVGRDLEISVSDNGEGMTPATAEQLFEPFFTTKPDGMGLGLAISRSIVETHGGRLDIRPNAERGVTVFFTLASAQKVAH